MKLTEQQLAVIDYSKNPTRNLIVSAVAGSGKTFTLIQLIKNLTGRVAFCAYSKAISVEIGDKVDAIKHELKCQSFVGTCHSFGNSSFRKAFPQSVLADGDRCEMKKIEILLDTVEFRGVSGVPEVLRSFVRKAYTLARQWGVGVMPEFQFNSQEAWLNLTDHFDLDEELYDGEEEPTDLEQRKLDGIEWTKAVISAGIKMAPKFYDFEDMVYLPLKLNTFMWQYDYVLVDECQDLNPTRRALVRKMLKPNGKAIFVGDPFQAIFGFTGADSNSMENIEKEFNTVTLPLTYSFRCAQNVVKFAQNWVGHIQATPDAPFGKVETIDSKDLFSNNLSVNDAILCRNNAPLVDLFFSLLSKGIPAHIEGKNIAEELIRLINRFKVKTMEQLIDKLEEYKEKQTQKWAAKGKEQKAEKVADLVNAIISVANGLGADVTVAKLRQQITDMYIDTTNGKKKQTLTLTTIHKAKGREWNRVFWYGRNLFNPSPYARKAWQVQSETNLCYVAATRAKETLIDVRVDRKDEAKKVGA